MMDEKTHTYSSVYGDGYRQGAIDVLATLNSLVTWPTNDLEQLSKIKTKLAELMDLYGQFIKED